MGRRGRAAGRIKIRSRRKGKAFLPAGRRQFVAPAPRLPSRFLSASVQIEPHRAPDSSILRMIRPKSLQLFGIMR